MILDHKIARLIKILIGYYILSAEADIHNPFPLYEMT